MTDEREEATTRLCTGCGVEQPRDEFYKDRWKKQRTKHVWRRATRCKTCCKKKKKEEYWSDVDHFTSANLKKYGINLDQYKEMLKGQGDRCKICGTDDPKGRGKFHVDHCHESLFVRGLLCHHCNLLLGLAKDDQKILQAAAGYLDNYYQNEFYKTPNAYCARR